MTYSAKHDHPAHYGGKDNPYEAIKVIEAWGATFCGGNALKYICRAGKKPGEAAIDDLKKAKWYLERAFSTARAVCDRAAAANPTGSAYAVAKVAEAWGLPEALADCIGAIQANSSSNALRHLNNHIIDILTTAVSQKETPAP